MKKYQSLSDLHPNNFRIKRNQNIVYFADRKFPPLKGVGGCKNNFMCANKLLSYNPKLKALSRQLRKNSTLAEVILWQNIKGKAFGYEFHRQVPINEFIVDFFCHELLLAIEIDGNTHDYKF